MSISQVFFGESSEKPHLPILPAGRYVFGLQSIVGFNSKSPLKMGSCRGRVFFQGFCSNKQRVVRVLRLSGAFGSKLK